MKYLRLICCSSSVFILLLVLFSCKQKINVKISQPISKQVDLKSYTDTNKAIYDSAINLFDDTAYKLNINVFDKGGFNETKANAILTLKENRSDHTVILVSDSIYTRNGGYVEFVDFDNDKIKDLLVFYTDGARANPRFHLYLINPELHSLTRVKGFEELTNAEFDNKNNIIISVGLSGSDYYSFYRITNKNKLINLGHSFEVSERPSGQNAYDAKYNNAIKAIKKDNKSE